MNVRYYAEARFPWPPGRLDGETTYDTEADVLPPNLDRAIRESGLDAILGDWFEWDDLGVHLYWRVVAA